MTTIHRDEWVRRYAQAMVERGGLQPDEAYMVAQAAVEFAAEWLSPEDCAAEEMSHWVET